MQVAAELAAWNVVFFSDLCLEIVKNIVINKVVFLRVLIA